MLCLVLLLALPLIGAQGSEPVPEPANEVLRDAVVMAQAGNLREAIELLERTKATAESEGREPAPGVIGLLGALYLDVSRPDEAYELLLPLSESSDDPALLFNAGRAAFALGKPEQGEALFTRSAELAPVSPAARALGLMRGQQGRLVEAYTLLRPWAFQYPDDSAARLASAYLALELERSSEAEQLLSDLPQDQPRVRLLWGELLLQQENPRGALGIVSPLAANEDLPPELVLDLKRILAEAHLSIGNPGEAVAQLAGVQTDDQETALLLARAKLALGEESSAAEILSPHASALFERPSDEIPIDELRMSAEIAREYGRARLALGQMDEAAKALEYAAELEPWSSEILEIVSERVGAEKVKALAQSIEAKRAQRIFNLQAEAGDATSRALIDAQRWLVEGNASRALALARREISLAPEDLRPQFIEVQALLALGRLEEADRAADRTLAIAPENADALYQKGLIQMMKGDVESAETMLRRAIDAAPDHTAAMNDLALLLLGKGEIEQGRQLLERILILQPGDERATEILERLPEPREIEN